MKNSVSYMLITAITSLISIELAHPHLMHAAQAAQVIAKPTSSAVLWQPFLNDKIAYITATHTVQYVWPIQKGDTSTPDGYREGSYFILPKGLFYLQTQSAKTLDTLWGQNKTPLFLLQEKIKDETGQSPLREFAFLPFFHNAFWRGFVTYPRANGENDQAPTMESYNEYITSLELTLDEDPNAEFKKWREAENKKLALAVASKLNTAKQVADKK
jgi:hypothetical protein